MSVIYIAKTLNEHGFKAWLVGGCVRDHFMNKIPNDWDLCTDAPPLKIMEIFPNTIPSGFEHGTVTIVTDVGNFEVTTLRKEGKYSDGRRPDEVIFTDNIEEDLARRDFTCNAIAHEPLTNVFVDPFNGQQDIKDQILRCVGDPKTRFKEDGLRVLRGCRFAASLEFDIDILTYQAMLFRDVHGVFKKVAPERIRMELFKIMNADKPSIAFNLMSDVGLLDFIISELRDSIDCGQNQWHAYDVWKHTMHCLNNCPKVPLIRMAALLHDIGKPRSKAWDDKKKDYTFIGHEDISANMAESILRRLRFSKVDIQRITHLVRHHFIRYDSNWSDAAVRRWIKKVGEKNINDLFTLARADVMAKGKSKKFLGIEGLDEFEKRVRDELDRKPESTNNLAVNGRDIMNALHLEPGPKIGHILEFLNNFILEHPSSNDKDTLITVASGINDIYPLKPSKILPPP